MNLQQLRGVFFKAGKMQFPEQKNLVRQLGADSMVLLKNSDLLPINRGKIALFGAGAVDTVCCGIYYNYVYTDRNVNIKEGLLENGFTFTTDSWLEKMEKSLKQEEKVLKNQAEDKLFSGRRAYVEEVPISVADMAEAILGTDTCIYVIRRQATYEDIGSLEYQLTEEEHENIKLISASFKNVILVLNSGMIELSSVARMKNVKAIILMGIPGMEAGNSLADVLTGIVNPSGRLTSTWAKKYKDYSTCYNATKRKDTAK
ncbi:MAG: glycoside hydrolase family 3 C-terminal domain-containing protein, partial [Pseudobutyrivibrio sp.]|nr:glycoside hydrolase family 3 C-terminal domain-containing protein [Pseudobutyrivibrio sp.]